jgi:hypothetical protein
MVLRRNIKQAPSIGDIRPYMVQRNTPGPNLEGRTA